MSLNLAQSRNRLSRIPCERQIRVLHFDDSIVVVEKPCNLRSVPGNAYAVSSNQASHTQQTSQQAWIAALESFKHKSKFDENNRVDLCVSRLVKSCKIESIPRKIKPFIRYWEKNKYKVVSKGDSVLPGEETERDAKNVYNRILQRQRPLLNLPEATSREDSAYGQLLMLFNIEEGNNLFVVHRLDCETSGRFQLHSKTS